jgi:hypothetical protein
MNQFESEALRLAAGIFIVFCIAFGLLRRKLGFWSSLPRIVMFACLGWFVSSLVVITTLRTSVFQGLVFAFAYFAVVLMTPPLLAAGFFELILGIYAFHSKGRRRETFPHFIAAFSVLACFTAYSMLTGIRK